MSSSKNDFLESYFGEAFRTNERDLRKDFPDFLALMHSAAIEGVWLRPGLSKRDRSLVTLSTQAALGRWDQVEIHLRGFYSLGGTEAEFKEVALHVAIYCGFPAGLACFRIWKKVAAEK